MAVPFLDAMAQAIYAYEGNRAGERAYRNNNPGNLRSSFLSGAQSDAEGYRIYSGFIEGYTDLRNDVLAKITGRNTHGLDLDSDLDDFFNVYAPSDDHNQPLIYASFVAHWLSKSYGEVFTSTDTFRYMLGAIGQTVE